MSMEDINNVLPGVLGRLLVPDNATIQQATVELKVLVKDPSIVAALCNVLATSTEPQVRQYAAVLLRRKIGKRKQWASLSEDIRKSMKENILQVMLQESEKAVRSALAQLVATVARHELQKGNWPHLLEFFQQYCTSANIQEKEIGMYVLSTVAQTAYESLMPHLTDVLHLCGSVLEEKQSVHIPFYAVMTISHVTNVIGSDHEKLLQGLLPKIIVVIQGLIVTDEDMACESLEIFDILLEMDMPIIAPYVKDIIEFSLAVGANKELGNSLRIKALSFVSWLARLKRKNILKLKLVPAILSVLYPILCEELDEEDNDEFGQAEANTAAAFAGQVIDSLALYLPPERIIPEAMQLIEAGIQSADPHQQKAAYWCMAVCAEGCADHIRTKHLQTLLQCAYKGMSSESLIVKNAAFFAIGQFSEHLQPDIAKYSQEILPILFDHMSKAAENIDKEAKSVSKIYYALEMFCENLGQDLLPYLPGLMEHLLTVICSSASVRIKELAISAVAASASAAKEELVPYFPRIIEQLTVFLAPTEDEDALKLQIQAIDTLGTLARTMGAEHFRPLTKDCIEMGLKLLATTQDPDLKRCIYGLFAAVSTIVESAMEPYLDAMVTVMMESVLSEQGLTTVYEDKTAELLQIFDDEDEAVDADETLDSDDDEDHEVKDIKIDNAYLDEKGDACFALGELCMNTGAPFLKHTETCYDELHDLYRHPMPDMKKAVLTAITQFCCGTHKVMKSTGAPEAKQVLDNMLATTVFELLDTIKNDEDRQVVMVAYDVMADLLKEIGTPVLMSTPNNSDINVIFNQIVASVIAAFNHKLTCQSCFTSEDEVLDNTQESEYDTMVIENAGDVIPALAKVVGGETFIPIFASFLPEFMKRMKKGSSTAEKSFAVGTIADTIHACGAPSVAFAQPLYPVFMELLKDEDFEVRNNAVFATGVLSANSGEQLVCKYPDILKELFAVLKKEDEVLVKDQICGAVCRMMFTRPDAMPLDQVIPVVIKNLPLKEDFDENLTVYTCIAKLYKEYNAQVMQYALDLLKIFGQVLGTKQIKEDSQSIIVQIVQDIHTNHPEQFNSALSVMSDDVKAKLTSCLTIATLPVLSQP